MWTSTAFTTEPAAPFGDDKSMEIFSLIFFVDSVLSVVNHPLVHPIH